MFSDLQKSVNVAGGGPVDSRSQVIVEWHFSLETWNEHLNLFEIWLFTYHLRIEVAFRQCFFCLITRGYRIKDNLCAVMLRTVSVV